jgi:hypothetical protein
MVKHEFPWIGKANLLGQDFFPYAQLTLSVDHVERTVHFKVQVEIYLIGQMYLPPSSQSDFYSSYTL